jgi:hypothetical protein
MYVVAPLSGNDIAERETDEASAGEPCGEQTEHGYEFLQQAHVGPPSSGRWRKAREFGTYCKGALECAATGLASGTSAMDRVGVIAYAEWRARRDSNS